MVVDINEIERCLRFFKEINEANIEEIVWKRGDETLQVEPEELEDFKYMGLSNRDFPSIAGWLPDDVGIRAIVLKMTKP